MIKRTAIIALGVVALTDHSAALGDAITSHPVGTSLASIFSEVDQSRVAPTGVRKRQYLALIAANVDFFKRHQDAEGRIVDPVSKGERQYSTPAFAAAAGLLVREAKRDDLLEPATRAMTCALTALTENRAADRHPDFYIPMLVHAHRFLKDVVPAEQAAAWEALFRQIDPEAIYRADLRHMNWNLVSSSGELLRRHDGLVAVERRDAQQAYLDACLAGHVPAMTSIGLFADPGSPMIYDAFSRLWLEDVFADGAYSGPLKEKLESFLTTGGLSTLLLTSPTGEWAIGGRSGLHNWGEAQLVAICEMNATRWKRLGRDDVAGAFKRAAHLAFQSLARWQRPSGELWILKNRAEPATRFGYEEYSNHSQYNLLPMAMLAIAYARADESIGERQTPAEVGGYVFDLGPTFHKVVAAAGGYQVLIDTAADAHYNATGLQRVSRSGVPFSALSDTSAADRIYEPKDAPKRAISFGLQWHDPAGGPWVGIADFANAGDRIVRSATVKNFAVTAARTSFAINYQLSEKDKPELTVVERYQMTPRGLELSWDLVGAAPRERRVQFPILIDDGSGESKHDVDAGATVISNGGAVTRIRIVTGSTTTAPTLSDERFPTHVGWVRQGTVAYATHVEVTLEKASK